MNCEFEAHRKRALSNSKVIILNSLSMAVFDEILGGVECEEVGSAAEAHDLTCRHGRDDRVSTEFFAGMDIAQVDFDCGKSGVRDGVADGIRVMRVRARVDDDRLGPGDCVLDEVDDLALDIRLANAHVDAERFGVRLDRLVQGGEIFLPVDVGIAVSEHIQVRTKNKQNKKQTKTSQLHFRLLQALIHLPCLPYQEGVRGSYSAVALSPGMVASSGSRIGMPSRIM